MQTCEYHPGKPAVEKCGMCGVPLCKECSVPDEHGRVICRRCTAERLVKNANSELLESELNDPYQNGASRSKARKMSGSMNIFFIVGILLVITEGVFYLCMDHKSLTNSSLEALSNPEVPCALVLSAIRRYHEKYEFYPKSLEELKQSFLSEHVNTTNLKYRKNDRGEFELLQWDPHLKNYLSYTKNGCELKKLQQGEDKE